MAVLQIEGGDAAIIGAIVFYKLYKGCGEKCFSKQKLISH
jgi:hypothetical protein